MPQRNYKDTVRHGYKDHYNKGQQSRYMQRNRMDDRRQDNYRDGGMRKQRSMYTGDDSRRGPERRDYRGHDDRRSGGGDRDRDRR